MDVMNVEQAKIAEAAGAVAVMALERIPADIRRDASRGIDHAQHEAFIDTLLMIKANLNSFDELRRPAADGHREAADD